MLGFPSVISLMIFFFFGIIMRFSISTPTLHDTLLVLSCKFVCIAQNPCVAAFEMSTHILAYCVAIARFDKEWLQKYWSAVTYLHVKSCWNWEHWQCIYCIWVILNCIFWMLFSFKLPLIDMSEISDSPFSSTPWNSFHYILW